MSRQSTYSAIRTVAFYYAVHPKASINRASKATGVCWETVKKIKILLDEISVKLLIPTSEPFMQDGKTPICVYCKKPMKHSIPKRGEFKGELHEHIWICDCKDYPRGRALSVG